MGILSEKECLVNKYLVMKNPHSNLFLLLIGALMLSAVLKILKFCPGLVRLLLLILISLQLQLHSRERSLYWEM
jgi:hypothetical protein